MQLLQVIHTLIFDSLMLTTTRPGELAPVTGLYEEAGFGGPTGRQVMAAEGQVLPWAPPGYRWRLVSV